MVRLRDRPTLKPEWLRQLTATPRPLGPPWLLGARASPRESVWGSLSPTPRRAGISAPLGRPLRVPRGEQKESEKLEVAKRMLWLQAPLFQGCASFPSPHLYVTAHSVNTLMALGPSRCPHTLVPARKDRVTRPLQRQGTYAPTPQSTLDRILKIPQGVLPG